MIRLSTADAGFASDFAALVNARREADADVARDVAAIVARVRNEGDAAVAELTRKFDGHDLDASGWQIDLADCRAAYDALAPQLRAALDLAAARIRTYHAKQRPADSDSVDDAGVRIGARWSPVEAAGVYSSEVAQVQA